MFRINTVSLCAALVLTFGLVSCGKSQKTERDNYRAPAPRIIKDGQTLDFNGWDRNSRRTLDIQDSLDVRNSGSTEVKIVTDCRSNNLKWESQKPGNEAHPIPLFQFLPEELLLLDLNKQDVTCAIELTLFNAHKSKHVYNIAHVTLRDGQAAPVVFEQRGRPTIEPRPRFRNANMDGVIFRSPVNDTKGEVLCQDAQTASISVGAVGRLAEFDFNGIIVKENRAPDILKSNHIQPCRIVLAQNGSIQTVSTLFDFEFERAPLFLRPLAQFNRNDLGGEGNRGVEALRGQPFLVATYLIENHLNTARSVRLTKAPLSVDITATVRTEPFLVTINRNFLFVEPTGSFEDKGDHYLLKVPENGQLQLNVVFKAPQGFQCARLEKLDNTVVLDLPRLNMEEVAVSGEVLGTLSSDLGPRVYIAANKLSLGNYTATPVPSICQW